MSGVQVLDPTGGFDRRYQKTCATCGKTMVHRVATINSPIWANQHRWECPRDKKWGGCGNVDAWTEPLEAMAGSARGPAVFDTHLQRGPSMTPEKPPTEDTFGTKLPTPHTGWVGDSEAEEVVEEDPLFQEARRLREKPGDV